MLFHDCKAVGKSCQGMVLIQLDATVFHCCDWRREKERRMLCFLRTAHLLFDPKLANKEKCLCTFLQGLEPDRTGQTPFCLASAISSKQCSASEPLPAFGFVYTVLSFLKMPCSQVTCYLGLRFWLAAGGLCAIFCLP